MSEPRLSERELDFNRYTLWFIYACIIYSIIGFSWGVIVSSMPDVAHFVRNRPHGDKIMLGHAHLNLLGWVEMAIFGAVYYLVPRLVKRPIYSLTLVKVHFWMHNFGLLGLVGCFVAAGVVGGRASVSLPPSEVSMLVLPLMMAGGLFGTLVLLANCIWGYNIYRTSRRSPRIYPQEADYGQQEKTYG